MPAIPALASALQPALADSAPAPAAHAYVELLTAVPPRLLGYVGFSLAAGAGLWRLWVLPRAAAAVRANPPAFARAREAAALVGGLGGAAGVVAAGWGLAVQLGTLQDPDAPDSMLGPLVLRTGWGHAWSAQLAAFVAAGLAFFVAWRAEVRRRDAPPAQLAAGAPSGAWLAGTVAALAAAALQAGLGHAASDEAAPTLALGLAGAHAAAAAAWLGTLAVMALAWRVLADPAPDPVDVLIEPAVTGWAPAAAAPRDGPAAGGLATSTCAVAAAGSPAALPTALGVSPPPVAFGDGYGPAPRAPAYASAPSEVARPPARLGAAALIAPQVAAFSPLALAAAGVTAAAGVGNAWLRLGGAGMDGMGTGAPAGLAARLAAIPGADYGRILLAKLVLVLAVAVVGALNNRRTAVATPAEAAGLDRAVRAELALAAAVLVLSAALGLSSPPGTE